MIPIDERSLIDDDQIQTTGDLALCLQRTCMNAVCWTFHIFWRGTKLVYFETSSLFRLISVEVFCIFPTLYLILAYVLSF